MKHMMDSTKSQNDYSFNTMLSAYNMGPARATKRPVRYSIEVKRRAEKYMRAGIA